MNNVVRIAHKSYGIVLNTKPPPSHQKEEELWQRDPRIKEAKQQSTGSQHFINHVIECYRNNLKYMKANLHLTVGKQRF